MAGLRSAAEAIGYTYGAAAAGLRHRADFGSMAMPANLLAGMLDGALSACRDMGWLSHMPYVPVI